MRYVEYLIHGEYQKKWQWSTGGGGGEGKTVMMCCGTLKGMCKCLIWGVRDER